MKGELKRLEIYGCYLHENNEIPLQLGDKPISSALPPDPLFPTTIDYLQSDTRWLSIQGFQICSRGYNNRKCEEIAQDIKKNKLLPRLISKQVNMLYGHGPAVYLPRITDGKLQRKWVECPEITEWLESWKARGIETDYKDFAKGIIKNFYYFRDIFVKWRFTVG